MPQKITLAFFSLALLSAMVFADNVPNRDVTCAVAGAGNDPFSACVLPLDNRGDLAPAAAF